MKEVAEIGVQEEVVVEAEEDLEVVVVAVTEVVVCDPIET